MAPKKSAKKKAGANRGFSTVSVAKKEIIEVVEPTVEVEVEALLPEAIIAENSSVSAEKTEEWTEEMRERDELQSLMEKVRTGCEREVTRMSKIVDYERRLAKSFPGYRWAELELQRRIIKLAVSSTDITLNPVYEGEDKVVSKVAILFKSLEQLGFTKEKIEECLRAVKNLEMEDALDWLFLRCDTSELGCEGPIIAKIIEEPIHPTPAPATPARTKPPPLAITPRVTTSTFQLPSPITSEPPKIDAAHRARILAYDDEDDSSEDEKKSDEKKKVEEDLDASANTKWANYKLLLSEVQRDQIRSKKSASRGKVVKGEQEALEAKAISLSKKMKTIEGDYLFRKPDAEKLFTEERHKLDASQLASRLNNTAESEPTSPFSRTPLTPKRSISNSLFSPSTQTSGDSADATTIASDSSSVEELGDMLGILEMTMEEEKNDLGSSIRVIDMALPNKYSGKTPRANLEETVRKLDSFATLQFKIISRSRAFRASILISWHGQVGRSEYFDSMQDVACGDSTQAFNYIATVALFAVGQSGASKLLPVAFRDLWDELIIKKKEVDDESYREELKLFKSIAELRFAPPQNISRSGKNTLVTEEPLPALLAPVIPESVSNRIKAELAARQQWPSYQHMRQQRENLPIASFRDSIMQTIDASQCVVLCGETGCGKSTQVPSFILEHEMAKGKPVKIFCTEPRRISAISLAQRVSSELGEAPGAAGNRNSLVGYSIRLDSKVSPSSKIIYATTGIVLRMLEGKDPLADVTHLIIDEVHERSIDSDFLLIVLKSLAVRKNLKVLLMSATVDSEKIAAYMGNCPVINVPGRTFPVTSVFLEDVIELTRYKLDANSDSPYMARKTRGYRSRSRTVDDDIPLDEDEQEELILNGTNKPQMNVSSQTLTTLEFMDHHAINFDLIILLLENLCFFKQELIPFSAAILIFLPSLETIRRLTDMLDGHEGFGTQDFRILPLHSTISNENQSLVFDVPPPGTRKIVISTNLAETGVTIPDITAVIDTGKHREMRFDEKRQISRLVETFVAQSNAAQRRGRAGRVQEGVCFHLFTKLRHDTIMAEHPEPEMVRLSLQDLALRIKIMKIGDSIEDVLLKALDPPALINVQRAIASLIEAKALTTTEEITPLGRHLAKLPMDVHLGKFLIMSCLFGCVDAALTIAAGLNSKSPWLTPFNREAEADAVKRSFKVENSDFLTLYNAYCSWREASANGFEREFTRKSFLSQQNFQMIEELRQQYFSLLVDIGFIQATEQEKRELISTRYGKSKTRFVSVPSSLDTHSRDPKAVMACLAASMYPKLLIVENGYTLKTFSNGVTAAIHPSSINFSPGRKIDFGDTKFIAFFTAMQTKKLYIWESGVVDERAVYLLCGNADFQLPAHSLSIDRKIRVHLEPKTVIAIKILRNKFTQLFNAKMKNPSLIMDGDSKEWMDLIKESLVTKKEVVKEFKKEKAVVKISLVKN